MREGGAFCPSTNATGIAIHQTKHTSEAVCARLKGFKGYVQPDAHCVYDALDALFPQASGLPTAGEGDYARLMTVKKAEIDRTSGPAS